MKNLVILFLLAFSASVFASTYDEAMIENIAKLNQSQNPAELVELSNTFDRIAQKETSEWLPLYYSAYAQVSSTFFDQQLTAEAKAKVLDKAQLKIDEAKKITENESEIYTLQALVYQLRLSTEPSQGYHYSTLINEALGRAETLNATNPRVAYLRGTTLFYTPSEYGGEPAVAKPMLEKAAKLFAEADHSNQLLPSWGEYHNNMVLEQCK